MPQMNKGQGDPKEIREVRNFQNAPGMKVRALFPVDPSTLESLSVTEGGELLEVLFQGVAQLVTPMGPSEMQFPLPARTLEEAFEIFEETARAAAAEIQKQASSQIVQANQIPPELGKGPSGGIIKP